MQLTQKFVGYLDRSYEQIKRSLLTRLGQQVPEISDHTENNPLIIILEMFSGIAEMLSLYIDRMAREMFIGTAKKYSSVIKLVGLMDYQIKAKNPSSADIFFSLVDSAGNTLFAPHDIDIPIGTQIKSSSNLIYRTKTLFKILSGQNGIYGSVIQDVDIINSALGITNGLPNQKFLLSPDYVHDSLTLTIGGQAYAAYNSFGLMFSSTKGFVVSIEADGNAYANFGDNTNGIIPPNATNVIASYRTTSGSLGDASPNTINQLISVITLPTNFILKVTNPDYASSGRDFETIEEIRNHAPRSIRTNNRTLTYQDYLDDPLLVPGVADARARYCCGKYIDVFIIPTGKGIVSSAQLITVQNFLNKRKAIGTFPKAKAAGITLIWIKGTIYGKPLISRLAIQLEVAEALDKAFGYGNLKINRKISASEIIALIEGLATVDFFELVDIRIKPYARTSENTINTLNIEYLSLPNTTLSYAYTVVYDGTNFQVIRQGTLINTIALGATYNDGFISFKINSGSYTINDRWDLKVFTSYPNIFPSTIIQVDDFSASVVQVADYVDDLTERTIYSDLTIKTQDITTEDLPTCD